MCRGALPSAPLTVMINPSEKTTENKPEVIYNSLANNYESWIEESAGLKIAYMAFYETISQNRERLQGRVLDLGCGTGIFSRVFSSIDGVREVVGIDISRESVVQAKARCNAKCRFLAGSATELPFPDDSFDAVVAFGDIISHIHEGYKDAIYEAGRVLRPGGHLIFDIDNKWNLGLLSEPHELKASLKTPFSGHIREWSFLDAFGNECSLHFKTFKPAEIKKILSDCGLSVIDFRGIIILPNTIPQRFHYNYPPEKPLGKVVMALNRIDKLICRMPFFRGWGVGSLVVSKKKGKSGR